MQLRAAKIALIGRFGRVPRARILKALHSAGATATYYVARNTDLAVIGHGGIALFKTGRLHEVLAKADQHDVPIFSENALLRGLGLLTPLDGEPRPFTSGDLVSKGGMSRNALRFLHIFDVIEGEDGHYSFRDLRAAREFARFVSLRRDIASALVMALDVRERVSFQRHLAELSLLAAADQVLPELQLGDAPETFDSLWEAALVAQLNGDYVDAANAYRRCAEMRPRDPLCLFNLASVLCQLDDTPGAERLLKKIITLEPKFAEAWLTLASLSEGAERVRFLERAVAANPENMEAVRELAMEYTDADQYGRAQPLWERFLSLASGRSAPPLDPKMRDHAKKALLLCRMIRLQNEANGSQK